MAAPAEISARTARSKVGKRLPVIIDEAHRTSVPGRSKYDAPEIDVRCISGQRPLHRYLSSAVRSPRQKLQPCPASFV